METLLFIIDHFDLIIAKTLAHISLVAVAVGLAIVTGVPIGIAITRNLKVAEVVLSTGVILTTIPAIALFVIMLPLLMAVGIGQGIGYLAAVIAVLLYAQLPIIRNTYTAINGVDPALREAARGVGMTALQRLARVEIPLALPVIVAGVRAAVVMNIGVIAIAAYIGAGGLGTFISQGIAQADPRQLMAGALAVSLLAIVADYGLLWVQRRLTPAGIR